LRAYLRADSASQGILCRIPRTWEIQSLPALLRWLAPGLSAGKVVYDLRQEHWAMRFVRRHGETIEELRKEGGSIVLVLRRRAEHGFGIAARHRLETLRPVLRWADLSGLRLETAILDGADLSGAHLSRADLSGEPIVSFPGEHVRRLCWVALRNAS